MGETNQFQFSTEWDPHAFDQVKDFHVVDFQKQSKEEVQAQARDAVLNLMKDEQVRQAMKRLAAE